MSAINSVTSNQASALGKSDTRSSLRGLRSSRVASGRVTRSRLSSRKQWTRGPDGRLSSKDGPSSSDRQPWALKKVGESSSRAATDKLFSALRAAASQASVKASGKMILSDAYSIEKFGPVKDFYDSEKYTTDRFESDMSYEDIIKTASRYAAFATALNPGLIFQPGFRRDQEWLDEERFQSSESLAA